jgi:hypothetical protein
MEVFMDVIKIKDYLPLIIALLTLFIGYIVAIRHKKIDRFYSQVHESLKDVIGPMLFEIRRIQKSNNIDERDNLIESFFSKYTQTDSPLYKIANSFLLEWFFEMEESFNKYRHFPTDDNWEEFWLFFYRFHVMIKNEFWTNFRTLYYEFRWEKNIWGTNNYLLRFLKQTIRFILDTLNFLVGALLILFAYIIWSNFKGEYTLPKEYIELIAIFSQFILVLWGFMMIIGSFYPALMGIKVKKSRIRLVLEKVISSRYFKKYDDYFGLNSKSLKKNIKIPPNKKF